MSENKRFRKGKSILTDFPTGAIIDEETVDLMNELLEKNKELQDFKDLWIGQNSILERENKALTERNQELTRQLSAIKIEKINEIIEQNKKLKYINKQVEDRLENSGIGIALDMGDFDD